MLPAADYRDWKVKPANRADFEALTAQADRVVVLPFAESDREAYMAASEAVLADVEQVVAVWDGRPSDGLGGTGDVVIAARGRVIPVEVVWPAGASRV